MPSLRLAPAVALLLACPGPAGADPDFSPVLEFLSESVADGSVAGGSLLIISKGETVLETGFGFADIETQRPFSADTPAVIASISKPLLGTALFYLAEKQKLDPAIPISEYLPEFTEPKLESGAAVTRAPTTIELLTHTSGLRYDKAPHGRPWFSSWTKGQPLASVVRRYSTEFPFLSRPGTRFAYSGIGTDVAARVAEVASGKSRNDFLIDTICDPLGMDHTYYRESGRDKRAQPMPTRYYHGEKGNLLVSKSRPLPPANTYGSSGGSIISTAQDMSRWLLMIRNHGTHGDSSYLAPQTIDTLLSPNKIGPVACGGFFVRKKNDANLPVIIGHSGSSGTDCWINFETDTIGILLTQTKGTDITSFRLKLKKRIAEQLAKIPSPPLKK